MRPGARGTQAARPVLALAVAFAATRLVVAFRRQQVVQQIESLSVPPAP